MATYFHCNTRMFVKVPEMLARDTYSRTGAHRGPCGLRNRATSFYMDNHNDRPAYDPH
jgi:hypothetical protein